VLSTPRIAGISIPSSVGTVTLKFWQYADIRPGNDDDQVTVTIIEDTGSTPVVTFSKSDLGLVDGTTGGDFVLYSVEIGSLIDGWGDFHIEFGFNSLTPTSGQYGEGWYVDDIDIEIELV
jgi:hypothetical protein